MFIINNSIITLDHCNNFNYNKDPYDYLIHRELYDDKLCMFLTNNIQDINKLKNGEITLQPCNFEFIMVLIKCNNKSYDISNILKNPVHYYYINGATLFNANFMEWISLHHLKTNFDNPEIVIMDKSVKEITLTPSQSIILDKDDYKIVDELI